MAKANVKEVFGQQLRKKRAARGWSQEHLADMAGFDRSYVGGVERGERNVSIENIAKLAKALDISLGKLMDIDHG